jgi:hypothetical protein
VATRRTAGKRRARQRVAVQLVDFETAKVHVIDTADSVVSLATVLGLYAYGG